METAILNALGELASGAFYMTAGYLLCWWMNRRRHKVGTPSASHNSTSLPLCGARAAVCGQHVGRKCGAPKDAICPYQRQA